MSFDGFNMLFIMALCCFYPFAELSEKVKIRKYFYSPRIVWEKWRCRFYSTRFIGIFLMKYVNKFQ